MIKRLLPNVGERWRISPNGEYPQGWEGVIERVEPAYHVDDLGEALVFWGDGTHIKVKHLAEDGWRKIDWNLQHALTFVRKLQPTAMASGYYLALAGSVLNVGQGDDLDLTAVPRTKESRLDVFRAAMREAIPALGYAAESRVPSGTLFHCGNLALDLVVIDTERE